MGKWWQGRFDVYDSQLLHVITQETRLKPWQEKLHRRWPGGGISKLSRGLNQTISHREKYHFALKDVNIWLRSSCDQGAGRPRISEDYCWSQWNCLEFQFLCVSHVSGLHWRHVHVVSCFILTVSGPSVLVCFLLVISVIWFSGVPSWFLTLNISFDSVFCIGVLFLACHLQ